MPATRVKRLVCHHCSVPLKKDDRDHYGYQCHACVVREHALVLAFKADPEHPDADTLFNGPVDLGLSRPEKT